ncbi:ATP-grasp domain-containing protein [Mucilaginibacter jinjuensis]|uniref:ATP-grasp domain-containing protein n=1 Tax=Mucilaginibacter jinjuensis TaxID=1176721 RepID=A0ABY7T887_9SPHI|nr:hypothetical protein [Mucilaginibacter jinjuensis]WCT12096.1 hypothetical protein PQO05_25545 [Mucilaginibacter jinjuensis]
MRPFIIAHQQPEKLRSFLQELEIRVIPYQTSNQLKHHFCIEEKAPRFGVFYNLMGLSAYLHHGMHSVFYMFGYLRHLEEHGVRVINGSRAFSHDVSQALQLILLQQLGIKHLKTHVINHVSELKAACDGLRFPIVIKPNVDGNNTLAQYFNSTDEINDAVINNRIDLGADHSALVQEFIEPAGGYITRVETIGGKYLYATKNHIHKSETETCTPSASIIRCVETIVQNAGIDVGGVEYIIDERTEEVLYTAVNTTSNFVNNAENGPGFNPTEKLIDFLEHEMVRLTDDVAVV